VEDALGHRQGPLTDVDRQEQFTLGLYGAPDPVRGARQAVVYSNPADNSLSIKTR